MLCRSSQHPTLILASQSESENDLDYENESKRIRARLRVRLRYAACEYDTGLLVLHSMGVMQDSHRKETLKG